jgi:hypothetical protein
MIVLLEGFEVKRGSGGQLCFKLPLFLVDALSQREINERVREVVLVFLAAFPCCI